MRHKRESFVLRGIGYIELQDGGHALVDEVDLPLVGKYNWHRTKKGYVARKSARRTLYLHHVIIGRVTGFSVDHRNRDKLDNRRVNLRFVTASQSSANRASRGSASGYRGVYRVGTRFVARITIGRRRYWLGSYSTAIDAARAYNRAARIAFGSDAHVNALGMPPQKRWFPGAGWVIVDPGTGE